MSWLTGMRLGVVALGMGMAMTCVAVADDAKKPSANAVGAGNNWNTNVASEKSDTATTLDEKQTAIVQTVSAYFNGLAQLKGTFVQTGPDKKRMKGKFYLQKPGKFRFDYGTPSKQVIISDGTYLAVQDLDINTEDRIALDQTPFRLLMRKDVDLLRDARIVEAQQADDLVILTVNDKNPDTPGRIRLFLATKPAVELKEWVTIDAQGLETRVEIADLNRNEEIDSAMFKIQAVGLLKNQ